LPQANVTLATSKPSLPVALGFNEATKGRSCTDLSLLHSDKIDNNHNSNLRIISFGHKHCNFFVGMFCLLFSRMENKHTVCLVPKYLSPSHTTLSNLPADV